MRQTMKMYKKLIATVAVNATFIVGVASAGQYALLDEQKNRIAQLATNTAASEAVNQFNSEEIECMALNIYFETHAISMADAMAVSDVVQNRVNSSHFPNTICGVVHDGYKKGRRDCQFSWYCDGKADNPTNHEAWERSRKYARDFYVHGLYRGLTEGSTHYHANYVKPYWAPTLDRVTRIGSHIFYRMK